jgi:hypothetical protein
MGTEYNPGIYTADGIKADRAMGYSITKPSLWTRLVNRAWRRRTNERGRRYDPMGPTGLKVVEKLRPK